MPGFSSVRYADRIVAGLGLLPGFSSVRYADRIVAGLGHPLTWPAMGIVGVGIDVVSIPDFAEQVDQPGTVFAETFTPGERRDASDKSSSAARHLAARWAAKEAVIKAWSGSRFAQRPVLPEDIHRDIEVVTDMWGRPRVRLTGDIARHLAGVTIHVSLTHEGDTAAAVAILESS